MKEKTKKGNQFSVDSKALNKKLNIGIFEKKLIIRNINVGSIFDNMFCDLMINGRGCVTLTTNKMRVNTDLKSIDPNVLRDSIEYLRR